MIALGGAVVLFFTTRMTLRQQLYITKLTLQHQREREDREREERRKGDFEQKLNAIRACTALMNSLISNELDDVELAVSQDENGFTRKNIISGKFNIRDNLWSDFSYIRGAELPIAYSRVIQMFFDAAKSAITAAEAGAFEVAAENNFNANAYYSAVHDSACIAEYQGRLPEQPMNSSLSYVMISAKNMKFSVPERSLVRHYFTDEMFQELLERTKKFKR